jgi:hypothetical protein
VLKISIDNDFQVFLNGTEITSGVTGLREGGTGTFTPQAQVSGWFLHDGCPGGTASAPTGDFDVPLTGRSPVTNRLLIIGRDRGARSFLDAAIVPSVP